MVLVVDDHRDTASLLTKLLRRSGIPADFVTSGRDALDSLGHDPPKLVILDVMMPEMNGIDTLRAMRNDRAYDGVSVMMYSADAAHDRMKEAMREGAQLYVVKGSIGWVALVESVQLLIGEKANPTE